MVGIQPTGIYDKADTLLAEDSFHCGKISGAVHQVAGGGAVIGQAALLAGDQPIGDEIHTILIHQAAELGLAEQGVKQGKALLLLGVHGQQVGGLLRRNCFVLRVGGILVGLLFHYGKGGAICGKKRVFIGRFRGGAAASGKAKQDDADSSHHPNGSFHGASPSFRGFCNHYSG